MEYAIGLNIFRESLFERVLDKILIFAGIVAQSQQDGEEVDEEVLFRVRLPMQHIVLKHGVIQDQVDELRLLVALGLIEHLVEVPLIDHDGLTCQLPFFVLLDGLVGFVRLQPL